jgi:ABC-type phosphate/phosphonate transport system ATPase subunit
MALALEILSRIRRAAAQEQITFVMSMHRQGLVREFAENVVTLREGHIAPGFIPALSQGSTVVEMLQ